MATISASTLQSWNAATDKLLTGRKLTSSEAGRIRTGVGSWPGQRDPILGINVGRNAVRSAVDRNLRGRALNTTQTTQVRAFLTWVRFKLGQSGETATTEAYIPPAEKNYPRTEAQARLYLDSLSPMAPNSARWNLARTYLARDHFALLNLNEAYQGERLGARRTNATRFYQAQRLLADAVAKTGDVGRAIASVGRQAIDAAERQYMATLESQGGEPWGYGLAVDMRLPWPIAVAYAKAQLQDPRAWVRDRASKYLASLSIPPSSASPPRPPHPTPPRMSDSHGGWWLGGGALLLLALL